mgnify:CR=1 FL=1|tara:strand:- start:1427 stop:1855 length:429 start_codon:yes stop_codon:yes gene_type:complete
MKRKEIEELGGSFSDARKGGDKRRKAAEAMIQANAELNAASDPAGVILSSFGTIGEAVGTAVGGPAGGQVGRAAGEMLGDVGRAVETRPERKAQYEKDKDVLDIKLSGKKKKKMSDAEVDFVDDEFAELMPDAEALMGGGMF